MILLCCLFLCGGSVLASVPTGDDFDPENPADPEVIDYCWLKVSADPEEGAYVSESAKYKLNGNQVYISTSARNTEEYTYTFQYWTLNGVKTSYSQNFYYTPTKGKYEFVAHYEKKEVVFDPSAPLDPPSPNIKKKYYLYLTSNIEGACTFNMSSGNRVQENKEISLSVNYQSAFYKFEGWKLNGQIISTESYLNYTMPSANTTLEACFSEISFDPESPIDPESNGQNVDNTTRKLLDIQIGTADSNVDKTRIVINEARTLDYDTGADASKMLSGNANFQIYSLDAENNKYSVNERPKDNGVVPLGVVLKNSGSTYISASRLDCSAVLKDKLLNATHDLSLGKYQFTADAGTIEDRFELLVSVQVDTPDDDDNKNKSVTDLNISDIAAVTYNGQAQKPTVTVKDGNTTLTSGTDYTIAYSNNVNAGTATVTITGKGNYKDTKTASFTIDAKEASSLTISDIAAVTYNGGAHEPAVTVKDGSTTLTSNIDYTIAYSNNINAGKATVTVTGKGNYKDTKTANFTINAKSVSGLTLSDISAVTYNGQAQKPAVTVKDGNTTLTSATDYTVSYSNNVNAGKATITVTGKGNYKDIKTANFTINVKSISGLTINDITAVTYNGNKQEPAVTVKDGDTTLTSGTDYTVAYSNNINAGKATVTVTGKGNYKDTKTANFTINAKSASGLTVSDIAAVTYNGGAHEPAVTVTDGNTTLTSNVDYTIAYSNNVNAGKAMVTVTGKGNYKDTKTANFTINAKSASGLTLSDISAVTYNGQAQKPAVTVKDGNTTLTSGTDYTVAYSNNVNAGKATITVTGKGNYKDTKTANFTINVKSISGLTLSDISAVTYNGQSQEPAVTVKDENITLTSGTDYTVAYSNNVNAGKATITVTGKGNYKDIKTTSFTINKATLTVTAKDYTIKEGEDFPKFEAKYEGFVNNETINILDSKPVLTTTAISSEKSGTYDITVSGGKSANYAFSYKKGTLTILSKKGDVNGDGVINVVDVVCIVNHINKKENSIFVTEAADTNDDGRIDSTDVDYVVNLVLGR